MGLPGGVRERPNRHDWKSCVGQPTVGSNPTLSAYIALRLTAHRGADGDPNPIGVALHVARFLAVRLTPVVTLTGMHRRYATGRGDERTVLLSFLDQYRDTIVFKIEGLEEEQARWRPTEQANSLLALVVHLTLVERNWIEETVLGHNDADCGADFAELLARTTVPESVSAYLAQGERTNEAIKGVDLDEPCVGERGYSVRWVVIHLIEETARHAGHADITRELIDGSVGD